MFPRGRVLRIYERLEVDQYRTDRWNHQDTIRALKAVLQVLYRLRTKVSSTPAVWLTLSVSWHDVLTIADDLGDRVLLSDPIPSARSRSKRGMAGESPQITTASRGDRKNAVRAHGYSAPAAQRAYVNAFTSSEKAMATALTELILSSGKSIFFNRHSERYWERLRELI